MERKGLMMAASLTMAAVKVVVRGESGIGQGLFVNRTEGHAWG